MLKYLLQDFIFYYFKNYGSLTCETRLKVAANMEGLTCLLLATVCTLNLTRRCAPPHKKKIKMLSI